MKTQTEVIEYQNAMYLTRAKMREALIYNLTEALATVMPTINTVTYEWQTEYDDNGAYIQYVDRYTLVLENNDVLAYAYAGGCTEDVEFCAEHSGETEQCEPNKETGMFVRCGMIEDGYDRPLGFLTGLIESIVVELGRNIERLDVKETLSQPSQV